MPTVLCKTNESGDVESLCRTALTCAVFRELALVQDAQFFFAFHVRLVRFVGAILAE